MCDTLETIGKEPKQLLLDEIYSGSVENWSQLEIKSLIYSVDLDSTFLKMLIRNIYEVHILKFMQKSMIDYSELDGYFLENYDLVENLIRQGDASIYNISERTYTGQNFSVVEFFRKVDIRNPVILLKFFLHADLKPLLINERICDSMFDLFNFVLKRTEIRAEKDERFSDFLKRLTVRMNDISMIGLMSL